MAQAKERRYIAHLSRLDRVRLADKYLDAGEYAIAETLIAWQTGETWTGWPSVYGAHQTGHTLLVRGFRSGSYLPAGTIGWVYLVERASHQSGWWQFIVDEHVDEHDGVMKITLRDPLPSWQTHELANGAEVLFGADASGRPLRPFAVLPQSHPLTSDLK